jgi:hypothetical protein
MRRPTAAIFDSLASNLVTHIIVLNQKAKAMKALTINNCLSRSP